MKKINVIKNKRKKIEQLRRERALLRAEIADAERREKRLQENQMAQRLMNIQVRDSMRNLWLFIRYIPAFYRLWKEWGMYPGHIDFALRQYIGVISELTGGKLSKLCYGATYILDEIRENYCDGCDLKGETK